MYRNPIADATDRSAAEGMVSMSQNPPKAGTMAWAAKYHAIPARNRTHMRNGEAQFSIESGRMTANCEAMPRTTSTALDSRPNDEDLPIWLCVDPSRDERETRKDNGQIGAPVENNPAIPQLIGSRRLLTTISHGIPSSLQRCRNAALNRKSPDSENLFSHARRDARRADGKQRLRRRAPPIIHDVDQLRARGATSRLFQRLVRAWDVLDGAQAV